MGLCTSKLSAEERVELQRNREIENENAKDVAIESEKIKLLLLGAGESGKSTLFKQMRILYGAPLEPPELRKYLPKIGFNIMEGLQSLALAVGELGLEDAVLPENVDVITSLIDQTILFRAPDKEMADLVKRLWCDPGVGAAWLRRAQLREAQVAESFAFFAERVGTLSMPGYVPTVEEMLLCRVRTTAITSSEYTIKGATFALFDVGGQKNERKKWIHCFDHVQAVLFVASLGEVDMTLFEDPSERRMTDAVSLFQWVCSQSCFEKTSMLLFLNKKDLFEAKVRALDLGSLPEFSDYAGKPHDVEDGLAYFSGKFHAADPRSGDRPVFTHVTCATDTAAMEFVFDACRVAILEEQLKLNFTY